MVGYVHFFSSLKSDEIQELRKISMTKSYKKGEFLFMEGEPPKWLHILIKGSVGLYKTSPKGKEIFLHDIRPVSFIAELANFESINYPASAIFTSNGEVIKIDYDKFKNDFLMKPEICFEFLKSLSNKLKLIHSVFHQELSLDSDGKIALFISENFDLFTTLKHSQISRILNIAPETFSRSISKFKKEGLLIMDSQGKIDDYDMVGLSKYYAT